MSARAITAAILSCLAVSPAWAQQDAVSPFDFTCGQLLSAQPGDDRIRANMMIFWAVGYMYGRFGDVPEASVDEPTYQQGVADMVAAFQRICPNVPDMPIATFTENLANDLGRSLGQ